MLGARWGSRGLPTRVAVTLLTASALALLSSTGPPVGDAHATTASSTRVSHFQGGPSHIGRHLDDSVVPPLTKRWQRKNTLQPGAGSSWAQTPLIVNGVVYSMELQYQASVLSARKLSDGTRLWERVFPLEGYGRGSISYGRGRLYAVHTERTTAIRPGTGQTVWSKPAGNDWGFAAAAGGVLAVRNRTLDPATGRVIHAVRPGDAWVQFALGGTVVGDAWYVLTTSHLARYSLSTGNEVWSRDAAGFGVAGDPVVANKHYVVQSEFSNGINTLYVSRASDGKAVRTIRATLPPALHGAVAIVANDRSVSAVDLRTGAKLWTEGPLAESVAMPPALAGRYVYVATTASDGGPSHLYALHRGSGEVAWSTKGPTQCGYRYYFGYGSAWPSISVAQGRVAVPLHCGVAVYGPRKES